ncbi:trypsin-like serine peptidase [Variovorax boronicumulans]|uniref:trypsin-like serine peptidase n=1 Tax=Variovorax boronicumulans TaxID=436515 RepID=UPI001112E3CF|nr:serine protease [Variovorax boronicumulans]
MKVQHLAMSAILAFLGMSTCAQPTLEGRIEAANIIFAVPAAAKGRDILFEKEVFDRPGEESFRLRFNDIQKGAATGDTRIVIRNRANEIIEDISIAAFAVGTEYWTRVLPGSYALIQVVGSAGSTTPKLSFRVDRIGTSAKGARLLSKRDPFNPKDRPIAEFSGNAALMKAARSVAKLIISRDLDTISCTGFMVSPDMMVTNQHCISSAAACSGSYAKFGYERDAAGKLSEGEDFRCIRLLESDFGLDFAVIRLEGAPGQATRWGHLQWSESKNFINEPLTMIQHPDGDPKRGAVQGCDVTTVDAIGKLAGDASDFGHRCDTMTGSSGSPALDASMKVRGLHHMGFDTSDAKWSFENRAVKAERLRARISKWSEAQ